MSKIFIRELNRTKCKDKNYEKNRKRSKYVNFRQTPEEFEALNRKISMSGLTKQDFITQALLNNKVVVTGNIKSFTNIIKILQTICDKCNIDDKGLCTNNKEIEDIRFVMGMIMKVIN